MDHCDSDSFSYSFTAYMTGPAVDYLRLWGGSDCLIENGEGIRLHLK